MAEKPLLNVLIVEDERTVATLIAYVCQSEDGKLNIVTASSIAEAHSIVTGGFVPDLVFSDNSFPDGEGPSLFDLYRKTAAEKNKKVYIVLFSGDRITKHGADLFQQKPIGIPEAIRKAIKFVKGV